MNTREIRLENIIVDPNQPRKVKPPAYISELCQSILYEGLNNPITVRPNGKRGQYIVVNGECRFLAAKQAGLEEIPAIVKNFDSDLDVYRNQIIDNLTRNDLQPCEEGEAFKRYVDQGGTVQELSDRSGKSVATIKSAIDLTRLPVKVQLDVDGKKVSRAIALSLLSAPSSIDPEKAYDKIKYAKNARQAAKKLDAYCRQQLQQKIDTGKNSVDSEAAKISGKVYDFMSKTMANAIKAGMLENCDPAVVARSRKIDEIEAVAANYRKLAEKLLESVEKYRAEHA